MSETTEAPVAEVDPRTGFTQRYAGQSHLAAEGDGARLALFADLDRDPVGVRGRVLDPLRLRAALSALRAVVQSDFRYRPKDRTAYMAYQRMRRQSASLSQWEAQRAYFEWLSRNDPLAWMVLDPIVTVQPDGLVLEVFSKDEGTYAQLTIDWSAFELEGEPSYGTTNVDFGQSLADGVERMRSYRDTWLSVGPEAVALTTTDQPEALEKKVQVPDAWLRGFLQVQSAATLPMASLPVAPVDLYNVLRHLRLNKDKKRGGRAMRVELVPGEAPRLVLEPWETVLETSAGIYGGRVAQVVRVWGRRRLTLARRFLPFVESADLHVLGSGLPNFWVLRGGPITLTLGLTGFTAANWSRSLSFDVLLPRPEGADPARDAALSWLRAHWSGSPKAVAAGAELAINDARRALQALCQEGLAMFDLARGVFRLRPLAAAPLDPATLAHRNARERQARDLLAANAVKITQENRIYGEGVELSGKVEVAAEKREYRPQMLVDDEGRVRRAECTCRFFRTHALKQGPCAHLVALRLAQAQLEARRAAQRGRARKTVVVETRTYVRRHGAGEAVYQLGLDRTRVRVRWGERSDARLRLQQMVFDSTADARAAYFARIDDLEARGFLDATAG